MTNIIFKPSEEQEKIINAIVNNKNVIVNAVAGSGKTTTVLLIANKLQHKKILQITYNKQLKFEVRDKIEKLNLSNIEIQTYHSLGVKYYDPQCYTDDNISKVLTNNKKIKYKPNYDIIIIDEIQDMTQNYYELVYKFIQDIGFNKNMLLLGDSHQGVYEFKNADVRYLLFADKLWDREFEKLTLNQTFRMTTQISSFVNKIMIGNERIISKKKSINQVYYYRINLFNDLITIYNKILMLLQDYKFDDFFILAPSLKNADNPCKKLENMLVKSNIPVYYTRNEEDGIEEQIISGKIVFTTFHQAKGRERKIVIIFGFDDSYFDLYAKDKNKSICPSEIYVAITRASEVLILLENEINNPLKFLKKTPSQIKKYSFVDYISQNNITKNKKKKKEANKISHKTTVKDLTSYLSEVTINDVSIIIDILFKTIKEETKETTINIPLTITTSNNLIEDVSDINGIIIPAMYESQMKLSNSSLEDIVDELLRTNVTTNTILLDKIFKLNSTKNKIEKYALLGLIYVSLTENLLFKLNQIDNYNWLTQDMIDMCIKNLQNNFGKDVLYEQTICDKCKNYYTHEHDLYGDINICGRIDAIDENYVWELKCTSSITLEHLLQLTIYAWLYEKCFGKYKKYRILNIRTGEIRELEYQEHLIDQVIELLFINKYDPKFKYSDEKFLVNCETIRNKYEAYDDDIYSVFDLK